MLSRRAVYAHVTRTIQELIGHSDLSVDGHLDPQKLGQAGRKVRKLGIEVGAA